MAAVSLNAGECFQTFDEAEKAVVHFCQSEYHRVRVDTKEKVSSYNKKVKEDSHITCLPPYAVYGCRYVCDRCENASDVVFNC